MSLKRLTLLFLLTHLSLILYLLEQVIQTHLLVIKFLGIKEMYGGVNDLINKILSNPIIIFEDESLIDLLNKILTCKLFKLLIISESKDSLSTDVSNSIFSSDILKLSLVEYYILYIRLLDYSLPNYFFIKEEID